MQKITLYIQPQLTNTTTAQDYVSVDMMEEDLITLTQVIQDVKSIDKVFTDYSKHLIYLQARPIIKYLNTGIIQMWKVLIIN